MYGVSMKDRRTSEKLRKLGGVWVKKYMEIRVDGRRPVKRKTWLENLEANMSELEMETECYEEEVQLYRKTDYKPIIIINENNKFVSKHVFKNYKYVHYLHNYSTNSTRDLLIRLNFTIILMWHKKDYLYKKVGNIIYSGIASLIMISNSSADNIVCPTTTVLAAKLNLQVQHEKDM